MLIKIIGVELRLNEVAIGGGGEGVPVYCKNNKVQITMNELNFFKI